MNYCDRIQNKAFKAVYKGIVSAQRFVCYVCTMMIPILIVYQVILRYVLKAPLMGIEELLSFPIIWLYLLGGSVASEQRNHIECGILTLYIKKDLSIRVFKCFKGIVSVVVCIWLTRWAYWFFSYSLNLWKTSDILKIPMFIGESALFIGLVFMLFFGLLEAADYIRDLIAYFKTPKSEGGAAQ